MNRGGWRMPVAVEVGASHDGFAGGAGPAALTPVCPLPRGRRTAVSAF